MAGTVKIWWHDGAVIDVRHHDIPVVNEPELGFELVGVSQTPSISGVAPEDTRVAIIETDVAIRYLVRRPGETALADGDNSKPIAATGAGTDAIGVQPGYTISFIEI
ncbi:MAG: hypothetical protein AAGK00_00725 [Pseudomonadota bacterium]